MDNYKKLFIAIKHDVIKSVILGTLLDTIIFYIIVNTIVSLLELATMIIISISVITSLIFAAVIFKRKYQQQNLKRFEKENPELKVLLRTANEYQEEDTLMTHAMFYDLFKKLKKVSTGTLIKPKEIYVKYLIIAVLTLGMVSLSTIGTIHVADYSETLGKLNINRALWFDDNDGLQDINNITFNNTQDIYGDANVALLGNEELDLELSSGFSEVDLTKKEEIEELNFKNSDFFIDPKLAAAESFDEDPIKETKIGREYLEYLKEE